MDCAVYSIIYDLCPYIFDLITVFIWDAEEKSSLEIALLPNPSLHHDGQPRSSSYPEHFPNLELYEALKFVNCLLIFS